VRCPTVMRAASFVSIMSLASVGRAKARSALPTKAFQDALMSRYRRLKIEGGAFFYTLALADRGGDLLVRHTNRLRHAFPASHHSQTHLLPLCPA
jgi:hypothetical protein